MMRGVRGATTVARNLADEIVSRTGELLSRMIAENGIRPEDVASAIFTMTPDLDVEFPAVAVRALEGWGDVPLLCAAEVAAPGFRSAAACASSSTGTRRPSPGGDSPRFPARRTRASPEVGAAHGRATTRRNPFAFPSRTP